MFAARQEMPLVVEAGKALLIDFYQRDRVILGANVVLRDSLPRLAVDAIEKGFEWDGLLVRFHDALDSGSCDIFYVRISRLRNSPARPRVGQSLHSHNVALGSDAGKVGHLQPFMFVFEEPELVFP